MYTPAFTVIDDLNDEFFTKPNKDILNETNMNPYYDDQKTYKIHGVSRNSKDSLLNNIGGYGPDNFTNLFLPTWSPTSMGVAYPTDGYSSNDASKLLNSQYKTEYSVKGFPAASESALQDARNKTAILMSPLGGEKEYRVDRPINMPLTDKPIVEKYGSTCEINCRHAVEHILDCPICNYYTNRMQRLYMIIIGMLVFVIILLLFMLRSKGAKPA